MELLGSVVGLLISSVLVVCLNEVLWHKTVLVGLFIMLWSSNFTLTLNFLVNTFTDTIAAVTCIERVDAMADLPCEKPMEMDKEHMLSKSWPENGILAFSKVHYQEGLSLVLNDLSFKIPAGKTCVVVGRMGADKLSMAVILFCLVEI